MAKSDGTRSEKFSCLVQMKAHPGRGDDLVRAYEQLVARVEEETATEVYTLVRMTDDPDSFYCFELFSSRADFDVHRAAALEGKVLDELNAATLERSFVWGTPVVSKGLKL